MKSLTALIPFFNEQRTIGELVRQLDELPVGTLSECIFVDDGSSDNSMQILESSLKYVDFKFQIIHKGNGGKSSAIHEGAKWLTTSHVVILDSDLELQTSDIQKLWDVVINDKSDFVFGYRTFLSHSSFTYRYSRGNQIISNVYGILFNEIVTDIMCGYKLMPSQTLRDLPYRNKNFGIEIEIPMQMWRHHCRPYEVAVDYKARTRSEGKSISVRDAIAIICSMLIFRIRYRRFSS